MSDALTTTELPATRSGWFWFRVAISTFFGLLTVALCVLWVRSYWWNDLVTYHSQGGTSAGFGSGLGRTYFVFLPATAFLEDGLPTNLPSSGGWFYTSIPITTFALTTHWPSNLGQYICVVPFWLVTAITVSL